MRKCGGHRRGDKGFEFVGMDEVVETAVHRKSRRSLRVGARLVAEGHADGLVSAGNTGAAMATAKMVIGMLPGIDRPALAALVPTKSGRPNLLLDVGTNSECKPHYLASSL